MIVQYLLVIGGNSEVLIPSKWVWTTNIKYSNIISLIFPNVTNAKKLTHMAPPIAAIYRRATNKHNFLLLFLISFLSSVKTEVVAISYPALGKRPLLFHIIIAILIITIVKLPQNSLCLPHSLLSTAF